MISDILEKFRAKILKFLPIPEEECKAYFRSDMKVKHLKAKGFFIKEGEISHEMAFVSKGVLRMFYNSPEGKEINTRFFFENDFVVAYQSFLLQKPGRYFIQALDDCELITVPHNNLQNAFEQSHIWNKFGRIVAEKSFILAEQRTEDLLFYNAEERYQKLLKTHPKIFEQIPLYHIASYLGIERESLSRLRKKLSRSNTIVT